MKIDTSLRLYVWLIWFSRHRAATASPIQMRVHHHMMYECVWTQNLRWCGFVFSRVLYKIVVLHVCFFMTRRGRIFHSEFWETRPYKPAHIRRTVPLGSGESQYLMQRALNTTLTRVLWAKYLWKSTPHYVTHLTFQTQSCYCITHLDEDSSWCDVWMCVDPKPEVVWVRFFACVVQIVV